MAQRNSNDHYAAEAKRLGYPARSVFKLQEILQKHPIIAKGAKVLDLGAAPGSFSLFLARQYMAQVVSCDLKHLGVRHPGITGIVGDFTDTAVIDKICALGGYQAVVSDAAPATSGDRLVDCARSLALVQQAWDIAQLCLDKNGIFLAKVFENGDERAFMASIEPFFEKVIAVRPKAVRSESMEFYILAKKYKKKHEGA
jgi:23S rRNA (uridine2552-2'-O)-methyltransferase